MADKLIYIPNVMTQKHFFCRLKRLDTRRNEPTKQNLIEVPNIVEIIRKHYYKTLGTSVIKSPLSPHFLVIYSPMFLQY